MGYGLSPPVRGSLIGAMMSVVDDGSIPARAGGARARGARCECVTGLSPPVRGSPPLR